VSGYVTRRLATLTDPEPVVPNAPWPIGTRMRLDGEDGPWEYIEVCGLFDNGPDAGGFEPIIRPVEVTMGHDCSPRKVSPGAVVSLGYCVEQEGEESGEWTTEPAELGSPFDAPQEVVR